jgi:ATP-dependent DNA ligase
VDGRDLRNLRLIERKMRLKAIMPKGESRVRYVDHIQGNGKQFHRLACEHDLEGIVGKWKFGTYRADGAQTSWVKIKNPNYSQADGRAELFEKRNGGMRRSGKGKRELVLA